MRTFVLSMMLLSFVMGLGFTSTGYLSKKCDEHPWEEFDNLVRSSKYECDADPWEEVNNKTNLIEKNQVVDWSDDCK